jgi:hypothetical protein
VTVSLDYNAQTIGGVSATHLRVNYPPEISIPGSGTATTVRQRVTRIDTTLTLAGISDNDTNSNGVDDALELNASKTNGSSVGPGPLYTIRFDCSAAGLMPTLTCVHSQDTDLSGSPFDPALAAQIACTLTQSAAP